jgi:antitoxin CcdA
MAFASTDTSPKRPINLSLSTQTIERAKSLGINLSKTVDSFLAKEVDRRYWETWGERNKLAVEEYNEKIRTHGVWGEKYRTFARTLD